MVKKIDKRNKNTMNKAAKAYARDSFNNKQSRVRGAK